MGSIPLTANALRPPDYGEAMKNVVQMQQAGQQNKLNQLQIEQGQLALQQGQMNLDDQKKVREAFQETGGDIDKTIATAAKKGVSPQMLTQLQQHSIDVKTKLAALSQDQLKIAATQNDNLIGVLQPVKDAPPEKKAEAYQASLQKVMQNPQAYGITDPSQIPQQYPGDDAISQQILLHQGGKQQFENQIKERETKAKEQEAQTRQTQATMASNRLQAEMPGGPLQDVGRAEMQDWIQKNPGKGPAEFMAYKAGLVPKINFNLQANAAGGLKDQALDNAAEQYWATGKLPPGGRGPAVMAQNQKIMNRASELHAGESITEGSATYAANKRSLEGLQKQFDQVTAFENTAGKNLDVFLNTAKKVVDSGSPLINRPLRSVVGSMVGSEEQAAFNAARTTALTEIAKVLNSSNAAGGVLSDSARHEVESLIGPNATLGQIYKAAGVLKQDMANRHEAYQDQIKDIQSRMGGKKSPQQQPTATPSGGFDWSKFPKVNQ